MEEIAFSDWPGQPVDLNSGGNPWLPAYGFQTPSTLLEREDFIGNPDAEYFLHNSGNYMYLETIQEETSDDLRSESDIESRGSPVGWLATDSETGSVICIDGPDEIDCISDRELSCPAKRRKQDTLSLLSVPTEDEQSLSRSSSLLQFETLEKQCQETCSSSPSIYSQFSFDSLDVNRKSNVSPDSLDNVKSNWDEESDYYKSLQIDVPRKKQKNSSRDSLLYKYSGSESSDTSEGTLEASRSLDNLKTWRSFEGLPLTNGGCNKESVKEKVSAENLSEDSGYSDHLVKSSSASNLQKHVDGNMVMKTNDIGGHKPMQKKKYVGFGAYDGEVFHHINGNFGVSYQDLSIFEKYDSTEDYRSPLIGRFMKNKLQRHTAATTATFSLSSPKAVNIDDDDGRSNYTCASSASEPNLLRATAASSTALPDRNRIASLSSSHAQLDCVSVPKNLNLICDFACASDATNSVAVKNWDLADLSNSLPVDDIDKTDEMATKVKREGSYDMAMTNRVDLSDDEHSYRYKKKLPNTPIVEFDRKVLKAISETSIQSIISSNANLQDTYLEDVYTSTPRSHVAKSTPNLAYAENELIDRYLQEERRKSTQDIHRKNSIIKSSTSTSGMSDGEDKTLTSLRSFGSANSKGVHFSPVVSEVNWRDDSVSTATPERESSYSFESTPEREIIKPKARFASPVAQRLSMSQPELSDNESCKREFVDTLKSLRTDYSKSQPDVRNLRRRGSQLMKKDEHGALIKAYVDGDGIQYKHTHLDTGVFRPHHPHHNEFGGGGGEHDHANDDRRSARATAMEASDAHRSKDSKRNKIGGFFQRLASFRFSNRKGQEEKAKLKKKQDAGKQGVIQMPPQRLATKDDYIYIPLKGGPGESQTANVNQQQKVANNNNTMGAARKASAAKPPLPKQPPRVVHASAKREPAAAAQEAAVEADKPRRRRRTTIDSGAPIPPMEEPMGLIETDLDTEVTVITSGNHVKTRSLLNLGGGGVVDGRSAGGRHLTAAAGGEAKGRPHKSMEFLLDKQNLKVVEPPENELQKGERVMSEHQLRVQRSLQKLTVPDWYKQSQVPREGFLLKKQTPRETRWTGTGSKTTSLSSLGSNCQSPVVLSPTPTNQPFVRWSTSKLNSTASSPCASTRSSFNARQANGSISPSSVRSSFSYRQPYLGWRSQERLTRPRTPAERLANTLLNQSNRPVAQQQESPEIQTSIKEVTSAIVHYVSGLRPEDHRNCDNLDTASQRSSSVSPRGSQKLCWLESSFVGTKPLDSPQTPVTLSESQSATPVPPSSLRLDLQSHNDLTLLSTTGGGGSSARLSPGSTTLEDVLDSLLGLPSTAGGGGRAPSPSLQETVSANTSPCRLGNHDSPSEHFRRRSEGSEPTSVAQNSRRVSFNSSPVLRCRYSRCGRTALAVSTEAASYKNCHNCTYVYCSRSCRRAHWEKHRKTCLFSRIGTLCRQVIAACKEQKDTLLHLSTMARRGYLSHGPGAVKCFFPRPEDAENFLSNGFQSLGELTYVRWQDLLPSEMGPHLYAEIVKMCKIYNPDTRLVLYVSVCVVSETPASGAVKWERQLVSRCAKLRLSKNIPIPEKDQENPETLVLTCPPIKGEDAMVKHLRELSVNNLQVHLRHRGVSLRRQHPEIHRQLTVYCEHLAKFTPVTVYPKDTATGKSFMCIIMLEADEDSLKKIETAGVRVKTVDVLSTPLPD